jgi:hypothetical protein
MLVLIRYCAKFIDSGVPEMATALSLEPSSEFEILMVAPDSCLISLILAPPFPIIQPIKSFGILISVVAVAVVAKAALAAPGWPKLLAAAKVAKEKQCFQSAAPMQETPLSRDNPDEGLRIVLVLYMPDRQQILLEA